MFLLTWKGNKQSLNLEILEVFRKEVLARATLFSGKTLAPYCIAIFADNTDYYAGIRRCNYSAVTREIHRFVI